jgi:hypothetical protein
MIHRIVVNRDRIAKIQFLERSDDLALPGAVVRNKIGQVSALGSGVLQVRSDCVDVEPRSVHQKPAGLGGLKNIVSRVKVDRTQLQLIEEVILYDFNRGFGISQRIVRNQATKFRLNSKNPFAWLPIHHRFSTAGASALIHPQGKSRSKVLEAVSYKIIG